jgi:hypothetical protein
MPLVSVAGALRERALAKLLAQNALLAALPDEVQQRLLPHMALADLRAGHELGEPGGRCARAFFPVAGVVCLIDGGGRAAAFVGREGAVGLPGFMNDGVLARPVVQFAGYGVALGREQLLEEWGRGGSFMRLLMRYSRALGLHIAELSQCRSAHSVDQQLASMLLLALERLPGQEVALPLEAAARLLGAPADQLVAAAERLCDAGVAVRRRPSLLAAHDRVALLTLSCGCAGRIDAEHRKVMDAADFPQDAPALAAVPRDAAALQPRISA